MPGHGQDNTTKAEDLPAIRRYRAQECIALGNLG